MANKTPRPRTRRARRAARLAVLLCLMLALCGGFSGSSVRASAGGTRPVCPAAGCGARQLCCRRGRCRLVVTLGGRVVLERRCGHRHKTGGNNSCGTKTNP